MLQLINKTPFSAQLALFPTQHGVDSLYIILKATFNISQQWTIADEQLQPQAADEYYSEDPDTSSIKYASDFHIGKPATDIVLIGKAVPPDGREARQLDVSLTVGSVNKFLRVFGDRVWENGQPGPAQPFTSMPLIYEKAFGGVHVKNGAILAGEARNPVGCGHSGKRKTKEMNGLPLPNLEDPRNLLQHTGDVVSPAGFGFISPNWQPRLSFAGTYDEHWQKYRAPFLPDDFDLRFFNMAHPDLIYPGYLTGGEPVSINGIGSDGPLQFNLPTVGLTADVHIKSRVEHPVFNLETLLLEPDISKLSMTWRAALTCDKETLKISRVGVNLSRNQQVQAA
jgi:hypothetical protein